MYIFYFLQVKELKFIIFRNFWNFKYPNLQEITCVRREYVVGNAHKKLVEKNKKHRSSSAKIVFLKSTPYGNKMTFDTIVYAHLWVPHFSPFHFYDYSF